MNKLADKLWSNLRNEIIYLSDLSRLKLVLLFQKVLSKYQQDMKEHLINKYPVFQFVLRVDIADYVADFAPRNDNFESVKQIFTKMEPSNKSSKFSLISEVIRGLLEYKTSAECPSCRDDELIAMFDQEREKILLICNICGWVQDLSGTEDQNVSSDLSPVKIKMLEENKLLDRECNQ